MQVPTWFISEMKAFDPELRVRWSSKTNLFHLERKITHGLPIDTMRKDTYSDDYIRAREGYVLVAMIEPGKFTRNIFTTLRASDLWSQGGWESMAKYIEDLEAREEEAKWQAFSEEIRYQTMDLYSFFKAREGSLIYNVGVLA